MWDILILGVAASFALAGAWHRQQVSATPDEALHLAAAHQIRYLGDYRVNREDPPGWQHLAGVAIGRNDLSPDFSEEAWERTRRGVVSALDWYRPAVFGSAGGLVALDRTRGVMVALAAVVIAGAGIFARQQWGPSAGLVVVGLLATEPLVFGHAGLMKNDVAAMGAYGLLVLGMWGWFERPGWAWAGVLAGAAGLAAITKFSGIGMILLALATLSWWGLKNRDGRNLMKAVGCGFGVVMVSCLAVWAAYGFRFAPTAIEGVHFNMQGLLEFEAVMELRARAGGREVGEAEFAGDLAAWRPGVGTRVLLWAHQRALLPEAYIAGVMYTRASAHWRPGYLLGEVRDTGWWYYFPVAVAVKTPVGTLLLVGAGAYAMWRWRRQLPTAVVVCGVGVVWYGLFAVTGNLNIGLRHLLPLYLPVAVMVGWGVSRLVVSARWRTALLLLTGATIAEVAVPQDRIAFFNLIGRAVGPVRLLGDSNLDWGQGVGRLARWQREHGGQKLYLCYFGGADPRAYGLEYENLPGSWAPGVAAARPDEEGLVAVSGTHLQGIYLMPDLAAKMRRLHEAAAPVAVVGGTIWVYRAEDFLRYTK